MPKSNKNIKEYTAAYGEFLGKVGDGTERNHIVYCVYDNSSILRYVGGGGSDRYLHVNSGSSHNKDKNRYYFENGEKEIRVDVVAGGCQKQRL